MEWKVKPPMEFHFLYHYKKSCHDYPLTAREEYHPKNDSNFAASVHSSR